MRLACMLVMMIAAIVGCRSAPASARLLNLQRAKSIFLLLIDYTEKNSEAPAKLDDLNGLSTRGTTYGGGDFRFLGPDRESTSEFLYYRPAYNLLEQIDRADASERLILVAGPDLDPPSGERLVVWSDGHAEYIPDVDFVRAVEEYRQKAEQAAVADTPPAASSAESEGANPE